MKRNIMLRWVKALRSGKYQQSKQKLKKPEGFCCLGVLCDISQKGVWEELGGKYDAFKYLEGSEFLPRAVQKWAGLGGPNPRMDNTTVEFKARKYSNLTALNDAGMPFEEIANVIEKNYREL